MVVGFDQIVEMTGPFPQASYWYGIFNICFILFYNFTSFLAQQLQKPGVMNN